MHKLADGPDNDGSVPPSSPPTITAHPVIPDVVAEEAEAASTRATEITISDIREEIKRPTSPSWISISTTPEQQEHHREFFQQGKDITPPIAGRNIRIVTTQGQTTIIEQYQDKYGFLSIDDVIRAYFADLSQPLRKANASQQLGELEPIAPDSGEAKYVRAKISSHMPFSNLRLAPKEKKFYAISPNGDIRAWDIFLPLSQKSLNKDTTLDSIDSIESVPTDGRYDFYFNVTVNIKKGEASSRKKCVIDSKGEYTSYTLGDRASSPQTMEVY